MEKQTENVTLKLPCGAFCGHNCSDGCWYWCPGDRDSDGRQWCSWYDTYYFPRERQGCLSYKDHNSI